MKHEILSPNPETLSTKLETLNPNTLNPKHQTLDSMHETLIPKRYPLWQARGEGGGDAP